MTGKVLPFRVREGPEGTEGTEADSVGLACMLDAESMELGFLSSDLLEALEGQGITAALTDVLGVALCLRRHGWTLR